MPKYIVLLLMSLFLVACAELTPFELGQKEYVSGNYIAAARIFSQHTAWNSDIKYEAMYYEGMCWFNLKDYPKAKKLFTNVIQNSNNRVIKAKAIAAKADSCLLTGDCDMAINLYRMLLLAGYADSYPQAEAYTQLRKAALQCGNSTVLDEFSETFGTMDRTSTPSLVSGLKRVRLEDQFTSKKEAMNIMKSLKDAGVDSSLVRISTPSAEYFTIQVGAFSSIENANNMAQKIYDLGWKVMVLE